MNDLSRDFSHGDGFSIGKFCVIEQGTRLGKDVKLGNYVYLGYNTKIGDGTKIDHRVSSSGANKIGKDCTIRYGAILCRNIEIGDDVFISPNVMTIYLDADQDEGEKIVIEDGAFIGTGAVINEGVTIGKNAKVGALSMVLRDVKEDEVVMGVVK